MKNQSIICFANDWENDPTSKHQVMKILSRNNRILWVDSIGMRRPSFSGPDMSKIARRVRKWFKGLKRVNENLYHFGPVVLPLPASPLARSVNRRLLIASVTRHMRKLNMREVQLWSFVPNVVDVLGHLGEKLLIYYCVDEWSKFSFVHSKSIKEMENRLLKRADLVIASAYHLYLDKVRYNPNTHLVTHGVDHAFFSRAFSPEVTVSENIQRIRRPIIGFFGLIHEWIDLELIERMAASRPNWSIVLIGNAAVDVGSLKRIDNVHLLGRQPYETLPGYCKAFDVGIIPFRVNDLTINVNPIKLKEYLAAGLPVVSTALPEVQKYGDIVEIGQGAEDFVQKVDRVLKEDTIEKRASRSERMKTETWENKVEEISLLVSETLQRGANLL